MSSLNDYPERDFLIRHANYFNRIITNSSLIITTRIRTISPRVRHIYTKLLHMVNTYDNLNNQFIDITIGFLRTFNSEGDYNRLKLALQRRGINVYDDDNSSVEVQRDRDNGRREPTLSNPFHYDERGVMIPRNSGVRQHVNRLSEDFQYEAFRLYRAMRRGDITDSTYTILLRQLEERRTILPEVRIPGPNEYVNRPVIEDLLGTIVIDTTIPDLEREPQRPSVNAFVEHLITRPNIKMTDWKQDKPEECPVCCGDCDEHPLSCGHYVCSNCIVNSKKATCPCCRQDVALDVPVYQRLYNAIYN